MPPPSMPPRTFVDRHPALFHVTDRAAIASIRARGLLSARRLHAGDEAVLRANRDAWIPGAGHALRRQGMRNEPLRRRLDPAIGVDDWRWFINGFVFLFATLAEAERLRAAEPGRDQAILRYRSAAVADAADLFACRFNNGFIDRARPGAARLRRFDDYVPIRDWAGTPVREVVAAAIPPTVAFEVVAAPPA